MKKLLILFVLLVLNNSNLSAQPFLTINNNSSCTLRVAGAANDAGCSNHIQSSLALLGPGTTVVDATTLPGYDPSVTYLWMEGIASYDCALLSSGGNRFCIDDKAIVALPGSCYARNQTECINLDGCHGCTQVTITITPGANGDATFDIN